MNKIEAIKLERDGLEVKEMIAHYAKTGWESIPEDDVQRLKWYGVFLRNPTPGFFMIRVRIPGGKTGSTQLRALADIAGTYGNGISGPHNKAASPTPADPDRRRAGGVRKNGRGRVDLCPNRHGQRARRHDLPGGRPQCR